MSLLAPVAGAPTAFAVSAPVTNAQAVEAVRLAFEKFMAAEDSCRRIAASVRVTDSVPDNVAAWGEAAARQKEAYASAMDSLEAMMSSLPHMAEAGSRAYLREEIMQLFSVVDEMYGTWLQYKSRAAGHSVAGSAGAAGGDAGGGGGNRDTRTRVFTELVESERVHINNLSAFITNYGEPLRRTHEHSTEGTILHGLVSALSSLMVSTEPSQCLTTQQHDAIFGSVESSLPMHRQFMAALETELARWNDDSCVGTCCDAFAGDVAQLFTCVSRRCKATWLQGMLLCMCVCVCVRTVHAKHVPLQASCSRAMRTTSRLTFLPLSRVRATNSW